MNFDLFGSNKNSHNAIRVANPKSVYSIPIHFSSQSNIQVKYMFEVFCKLRPGTTIMALYGGLNQMRRVSIYNEFCKRQSAVLFATDIAARGLGEFMR